MNTPRLLRTRRRLLARIQRAEKRLGKQPALPSVAGDCVEVVLLAARRRVRKHLFELTGYNAMLCDNARCVAIAHMGLDPRPAWAVELAASLSRWRRKQRSLDAKVARVAGKRIAKLQKCVAEAEKQLASVTGELGGALGRKPTTPCVEVGKRAYRILLDAVTAAVLGPRPEFAYVCHSCDNGGRCVNGEHLFWGTARDNARDRSLKGRGRGQTGQHLALRLETWREELREWEGRLTATAV